MTNFQVGLNEYPKKLKGRALHNWIYKALSKRERFSSFEISDDVRMARTIMYLEKIGKISMDNKRYSFPYLHITLK